MEKIQLATACLLSALMILPTGAAAQGQEETEWPRVQLGGVDSCNATSGVGLATYEFRAIKPRHNRYILADICADIASGWLVGPEVFEGLTEVQSYGPYAGQYAVLTDGDRELDRRSLTWSNVTTGLEEGEEGVPIELISQVYARAPQNRLKLMPDADQWSMDALLLGPASAAPLPEGFWVATINASYRSRLQGNEIVEGDALAFNTGFYLFERTADGFTFRASGFGSEGARLGLDIDPQGNVSGSLAIDARNQKKIEARDPREYDNATLELGWIKGRVVEGADGPLVAGLGVGRSLFRDTAGNTNIEDGWASFVLAPVPAAIEVSQLEMMFGPLEATE